MARTEPTHIRATHPYGFRSGEWARILTTVESRGHECWLVEFEDGAVDWWSKDAREYGYEFRYDNCEHDWVSMDNEVISGGEWCPKCGAVRATADA